MEKKGFIFLSFALYGKSYCQTVFIHVVYRIRYSGSRAGSGPIRTDNISLFSRFFKRESGLPGIEESFFLNAAVFLP